MDLLAGALVVAAASFLGGVTGFGYSLVATPLLLLLGFDLPFVVTANLAVACVTRISVAYRFRSDAKPRRAAGLIAGSVPGLWLGAVVLTTVDVSTIKLGAGLVVMAAAVLLWRAVDGAASPGVARRAGRGRVRRRLPGRGDLAQRRGSRALARARQGSAAQRYRGSRPLLHRVERDRLGRPARRGRARDRCPVSGFFLWLPGSLAGNWAGTVIGPRNARRRLPAAHARDRVRGRRGDGADAAWPGASAAAWAGRLGCLVARLAANGSPQALQRPCGRLGAARCQRPLRAAGQRSVRTFWLFMSRVLWNVFDCSRDRLDRPSALREAGRGPVHSPILSDARRRLRRDVRVTPPEVGVGFRRRS